MPFFSVLLPVRNSEDTIRHCLNSIASQTFDDYSVLALVNNSSDKSFSICQDFSHSYPHFNVIDLGSACNSLPDVLNFGISLLQGKCEYIVRHDADDLMLPSRLLDTFNSLTSASTPPLIHCGNALVGTSSSLYFPPSLQLDDLGIKSRLLLSSPFIHPAIAFKSTISNLYDSKFVYAQDLKFFIDNIFSGPYSISTDPYIQYSVPQPNSDKRSMQLFLHDYAINSLHRQLIPGFQTLTSHQVRCLYVTDEFSMSNDLDAEFLAHSYSNLKYKLADFHSKSCLVYN